MSAWVANLPQSWFKESLLLMRVDRPIGTWLLMWPSLWALAASQRGWPGWRLMAIFVLGSFLMRSAGCVANDITDRDIDPLVARTRNRPLAAGRISLTAARRLLLILLLGALALAFALPMAAIHYCVAGALLALTYPFAKRFIPVPQFHLGVAFAWGVLVAWSAASGSLAPEAWLLFLAAAAWTAGFDTIYAMMDIQDDRKIGVRSTAIFFGRHDIAATGLLYGMALALLALVGWRLQLSVVCFAALGGAGLHAAWQLFSIRNRQSEALLRAFLSNQWFGWLPFLGFLFGA
ncbi:MAG: 4-hydroxybenzoate octaprenyltransferase [Magnetococcales bacterium]|nr:4-hydroxybenzoate octaprenyltransferase [Magnetococcales bacterium]